MDVDKIDDNSKNRLKTGKDNLRRRKIVHDSKNTKLSGTGGKCLTLTNLLEENNFFKFCMLYAGFIIKASSSEK